MQQLDVIAYVLYDNAPRMTKMDQPDYTSKGIDIALALTVILLVLRLTDIIEWSYIWIFSPVWIPIALILLFGVFYIGFVLLAFIFNKMKHR